jgi:hypothetical protein
MTNNRNGTNPSSSGPVVEKKSQKAKLAQRDVDAADETLEPWVIANKSEQNESFLARKDELLIRGWEIK